MVRKLFLLSAVLLLAMPSFAVSVSGRVRANGRNSREAITTIVYAEPLDGTPRVQPGKFTLVQQNKSFKPRVLAIPTGSTVQFPNMDAIDHNVFSLNRPEPFDLGLYRSGSTAKVQTFKSPGVYRVFCNIHPQMTAVILVAPTSYMVETDANGNYRLDLPAGRYKISAWSERAETASLEFTVSAGTTSGPELVLDETKQVDPLLHKNKHGKDYPKSAYDNIRK